MGTSRSKRERIPQTLPLMPLRSTAVYPLGVIGVQVGMPSTLEMLSAHPEDGLLVAVVVAPGDPEDAIDPDSLKKVAVMGRVSDRLNLQFRTEFFNLFNTPNFLLPDKSVDTPVGGVISAARDPRLVQFALKLIF